MDYNEGGSVEGEFEKERGVETSCKGCWSTGTLPMLAPEVLSKIFPKIQFLFRLGWPPWNSRFPVQLCNLGMLTRVWRGELGDLTRAVAKPSRREPRRGAKPFLADTPWKRAGVSRWPYRTRVDDVGR